MENFFEKGVKSQKSVIQKLKYIEFIYNIFRIFDSNLEVTYPKS